MKKINFKKMTLLFLLILCVFSLGAIFFRNFYFKAFQQENSRKVRQKIEQISEKSNNKSDDQDEGTALFEDGTIGIIIIPTIGVQAPIAQGTSQEVLKFYVRAF